MPDEPKPTPDIQRIRAHLPDAYDGTTDSFDAKEEGFSEKVIDAIEMIGEEHAAGMDTPSVVSPGMRYLHCSRTIHQLVTDRNRATGIFLAVASLLLTASGAIYNANPQGELIIPMHEIQRWCLPVAFGALSVLAFFMAFLLIRTRVGLIYEVAKMNALLDLPPGRVQRNSPLSIHFVLQGLISCAGGASAALFSIFLFRLRDPEDAYAPVAYGVIIGTIIAGLLMALYVITVNVTTADDRLQRAVAAKR